MTKTFKMFILGRPGTGKTTYVKYLAKKVHYQYIYIYSKGI
ncbi:ATPase/DNA packaging protein [Spiroplasma endosymbiont of Nebria brevicollis]